MTKEFPAEHSGMQFEVCLSPASVEVVARRVVELLSDEGLAAPAGDARELIDAAEVARQFGVSRDWVYSRADDLGVVRVGSGPRPRLRFDPAVVRQRLEVSVSLPSTGDPASALVARDSHGRRPSGRETYELLPIRGDRVDDDVDR